MNLQIQQEAAEWFVEFRSGELDGALRREFDTWIRQSPEHLRAYLEMAEIWQDTAQVSQAATGDKAMLIEESQTKDNVLPLRGMQPSGADALPPPVLAAAQCVVAVNSPPRRAAVRGRTVAIAASVLLLAAAGAVTWLMQSNHYLTAIGEQRTVTLADGSTVELNSGSELRVALHPKERDIELLRGQALFHVAKDASRPFYVRSGGTQVRAIGTAFDVYRKAEGTVVTVVEGRVAVTADPSDEGARPSGAAIARSASDVASPVTPGLDASGAEVLLTAGEQVTVSRKTRLEPEPVDAAIATSWTQHRIVFKHTPLPAVFAELNRYNRRPLRISGSGLDDFTISGTYLTTEPGVLIQFLRGQPGITVRETDSEVVISKEP